MHAKDIINLFGSQSALAAALGKNQSTLSLWAKAGVIPAKSHVPLLELAAERGSDFIVSNEKSLATQKYNKGKRLAHKMPQKVAGYELPQMDLSIKQQIEINGIGMGVLSDGTPFLTERGLAKLCGVFRNAIQTFCEEWQQEVSPSRVTKIRDILAARGHSVSMPYIQIKQPSRTFYAYPDTVCLAFLEYYAFDAGANIKDEAKKNYRLLAGHALREFIYKQIGYNPNNALPQQWKQFHDRVSLTYNRVLAGNFSIFKEIADMIITLGQAGLYIDDSFVPDISVGQHWSRHWISVNGDSIYGKRVTYLHDYPDYFPQSLSNPQEPWCYPEAALAEFRRWFREEYIAEGKFKTYLNGKVKNKKLPVSFAQRAIAAYST